MFSSLSWWKKYTIEDRRNRFPKVEFNTDPSKTRKVGISNLHIIPNHIKKNIDDYYHSKNNHHIRHNWLSLWIKIIMNELDILEKYPIEDLERLVIIYKGIAIFDFYLIYDLHINDPETIYINLDSLSENSNITSNLIQSFNVLAKLGSFFFLFQNLF
jgi:hypothetical protein